MERPHQGLLRGLQGVRLQGLLPVQDPGGGAGDAGGGAAHPAAEVHQLQRAGAGVQCHGGGATLRRGHSTHAGRR